MVLALSLCRTIASVNYRIQKSAFLTAYVRACAYNSYTTPRCNTRKKKKRRIICRGAGCNNKISRNWEITPNGSNMYYSDERKLPLRLVSYNVLAQDLLESHRYLYAECKEEDLVWEKRWKRILEEITSAEPDVICLQEVQEDHWDPFYVNELSKLGYKGLYKKRTGARVDGVALWYRSSLFRVDVWSAVEFNIPGEPYLDRDNVAIVARLVPTIPGWQHLAVVVATTHLLYNTRRHDIKLAQTQLLLTECESLAYRSDAARFGGPQYWPLIITGDFNLLPYSGVYKLLTKGRLEYEGLCAKTLTLLPPGEDGKRLGKKLISPERYITDNCQYVHDILNRLEAEAGAPVQECLAPNLDTTLQNIITKQPAVAKHHCFADLKFGTGTLSHPFNLRSVYSHGKLNSDMAEATTYQNGWCSVDYIFYSVPHGLKTEGNLKMTARYKLFTRGEAKTVGPIPNDEHPSDHYPLMVHFILVP
ncbi:protein angel homolog 2-like isoform X1 [Schistocerca gregaria]|uniref:protein angel homolog 2-like isoform X1 n=1 Tax=Schistocerca gregaria TaxID=7010 RepID=UPI00211DD5DC|nr:protein angel homolog 2-like isoform X1 [Schistocerca gregaria]